MKEKDFGEVIFRIYVWFKYNLGFISVNQGCIRMYKKMSNIDLSSWYLSVIRIPIINVSFMKSRWDRGSPYVMIFNRSCYLELLLVLLRNSSKVWGWRERWDHLEKFLWRRLWGEKRLHLLESKRTRRRPYVQSILFNQLEI